MPYQRSERIRDQIIQETADILDHLMKDPDIGFVTVTDAEVSADLRVARIYVSILGNAEKQARCLTALRRAQGFVHTELGHRLRMKYSPQVIFVHDQSLEYGERIERLLKEVQKEKSEEKHIRPNSADDR